MEAEYQKTLSHSCLILKERGTCSPDSYEMRILAANRIEGLLPVTEEYVDNELRFRYDVTGLKPFGVYCERRHFRTEDLCCLFEGLLDLLERTEEYFRIMTPPDLAAGSKASSLCCFRSASFYCFSNRKGI